MSIKFYIGSELADFDEVFNVMFSIGDIRSLDFGNCNKTYTLNLPLTRKNKRLIKFISQTDVRSEPSAIGRLYLSELLIISGPVIITGYVENISVKVIISSDDWIDALKDKKMNELDLSASDHYLSHSGVEDSWSASYPTYRYPMIDFGALTSGESLNLAKWYPNDFMPMVSVASLMRKILEPYTISSSWLALAAIKDLYILHDKKLLDITGKGLSVSTNSADDSKVTTSIPGESVTPVIATIDEVYMGVETLDEANAWESGLRYTIPSSGTYRFQAIMTIYDWLGAGLSISDQAISLAIMYTRSGTPVTVASVSYTPSSTNRLSNVTYTIDSGYYHFNAGDTVYVKIVAQCNVTNADVSAADFIVGVSSGSSLVNIWNNVCKFPGINAPIALEDYMPDITQVDFLKAIKDIYTLRFWMDRMKRTLYIEPFNSFHTSEIVDITEFIDFSQEPETELLSSNYCKKITLKWRDDDSDKATTEYMKRYLTSLGQKDIDLTSLYCKADQDVRTHPFSSIMMGNNQTIATALSIARIWNEIPASPYIIYDRKAGFNTRIVEWKGMISGLTWYYETETKSTYPKIQGLDFATIYTDYWQQYFHYVDKGKLLTMKMKLNPRTLLQFFSVIADATKEGFRPTYSVTIKGIKNYFIMQKITSDGNLAEIEMILKV